MPRENKVWKPFREMLSSDLEHMKKEVDRLWDSFAGTRVRRSDSGTEWNPSLDVSETKNDLIVRAEIPGIDPKDIEISLSNGVLTIRGEKKQEKEEKEENYHLLERSYGSFTRSIQLPSEIQSDKINASYKDGILKITFAKSEEARKKEIKIEVQ